MTNILQPHQGFHSETLEDETDEVQGSAVIKLLRTQFKAFVIILLMLTVLCSACITYVTPETPVSTASVMPEAAAAASEPTAAPEEQGEVKPIRSVPTLAPTAIPGLLTELVDDVARSTGADRFHLLGVNLEDWINLIVSLLIFVVFVWLIARLSYYLLGKLVARTPSKYDNLLLEKSYSLVFVIFGVIGLQIATRRLDFVSPEVKQWLSQLYWAAHVIIISIAAWRVVDVIIAWYQHEVEPQHEDHQPDNVLPLVHRLARFLILAVGIIMILSINNINVDVLIAALGLGGLAMSLAAQDSLANMISGVILLLDKPFRVGDRVEIQELGTWGDVVDIGIRTTRIRTRDNRLVIVPNSKISSDQIINYTFPDPRYRIEMEVEIGYGQDVETVRQLIIDSVKDVEGVLLDKPVEVLYIEMGDGMIFRVRWWIESYIDTRRIYDRVNTALQYTFDQEGIELATLEYDIKIRGGDRSADN